jgi:hypothetical protein
VRNSCTAHGQRGREGEREKREGEREREREREEGEREKRESRERGERGCGRTPSGFVKKKNKFRNGTSWKEVFIQKFLFSYHVPI